MEAVTILIVYMYEEGYFVADMHNFDLFCHIPPFSNARYGECHFIVVD